MGFECWVEKPYFESEIFWLPWAIGAILQHVSGPELVNCPKDNSKKNIGMPIKSSEHAYGIRNIATTIKSNYKLYY